MAREGIGFRDHPRLRVGDERVQRVLEHVRLRVLEVDMHLDRLRSLARLVEGRHLVAHLREAIVRCLQLVEEGGPVGYGVRAQLREVLGEEVLRRIDLPRVRLVAGEQRHRAVVALRRHLVDHLPGLVGLSVEGGQRHNLPVHAVEHDDAQHAHGQ